VSWFHIVLTFQTDQGLMRRPAHQHEFADSERKWHMEILGDEGDALRDSPPRKRRNRFIA